MPYSCSDYRAKSQYPSLSNTIVNSSDHIKIKKQKAMYLNAKKTGSGFGVSKNTLGDGVVVTARNYADLLELSKGRILYNSRCDGSLTGNEGKGADTLTNDIWAGNKTKVTPGQTETDIIDRNADEYKAGHKARPMHGFRFPHRVPLN